MNQLNLGDKIIFSKDGNTKMGMITALKKIKLDENFITESVTVVDNSQNEYVCDANDIVKQIDMKKIYNSCEFQALKKSSDILNLIHNQVDLAAKKIDTLVEEFCVTGNISLSITEEPFSTFEKINKYLLQADDLLVTICKDAETLNDE